MLFQTEMSRTLSMPILSIHSLRTVRSAGRILNSPNPRMRIRKLPEAATEFPLGPTVERARNRDGEKRERAERLDLDQTLTDRVPNDAGGVRRVELLHNVRAVRLGGLHADPEQLGDFLRGLAGRDQLQHLAFTRGERIGRELRFGRARLDDRARDARAQ